MFYYKINHQHYNIATFDKFNDFLTSFDKNPFRLNDDKAFKKQLTDNLISYTDDYISLIISIRGNLGWRGLNYYKLSINAIRSFFCLGESLDAATDNSSL